MVHNDIGLKWYLYLHFIYWISSGLNVLGYDVEKHHIDVIMGAIASQITSLTIVYSTVYSLADQSKHQSSALLA